MQQTLQEGEERLLSTQKLDLTKHKKFSILKNSATLNYM